MSPTAEPAYGLSKEKEYSMTIKYTYVWCYTEDIKVL